jgi:TetR/AcrR family transcriptional regulator, cholesterol catabolism regulator
MHETEANVKKPQLVAKRREQIMQAAMALFRKKGYHRTTMREICNASKVNRGSIYDYFQSKEDILVYIYKRMMRVGEVDQGVRAHTISSWNELEPYVRLLISNSWIRHKHAIQLLYRESIALDQETLQEVMSIESDYIDKLAENLRRSLGWTAVNQELEIMANILAFITALIPMRGWNMKKAEQPKILDAVTEMFMMKLKEMRRSTPEKRRFTPKRPQSYSSKAP